MKAILVIDMPKCCAECDLCQLDGVYVCRKTRQILDRDVYKKTINRYCPLKPMPEKKDGDFVWVDIDTCDESYIHGWNDCIDEILGEEE